LQAGVPSCVSGEAGGTCCAPPLEFALLPFAWHLPSAELAALPSSSWPASSTMFASDKTTFMQQSVCMGSSATVMHCKGNCIHPAVQAGSRLLSQFQRKESVSRPTFLRISSKSRCRLRASSCKSCLLRSCKSDKHVIEATTAIYFTAHSQGLHFVCGCLPGAKRSAW